MRVWDRLDSWANDEAQSVRVYRRRRRRGAGLREGETSLYTDPQLQVALDWRDQNKPNETWAERYHPGFAAAMKFLNKSKAKSAEQKRRQQRALLITQATAVGMTLLAGVSIYLGATAYWASQRAKEASEAANTSRAAAQAKPCAGRAFERPIVGRCVQARLA